MMSLNPPTETTLYTRLSVIDKDQNQNLSKRPGFFAIRQQLCARPL
jgi:hypothetical protein